MSRQAAYSMAAAYVGDAIKTAVDIMHNGNNPSARIGAAKLLIDKVLPNLRATEISNKEGEKFAVLVEIPNYANKELPKDSKLPAKTDGSVQDAL